MVRPDLAKLASATQAAWTVQLSPSKCIPTGSVQALFCVCGDVILCASQEFGLVRTCRAFHASVYFDTKFSCRLSGMALPKCQSLYETPIMLNKEQAEHLDPAKTTKTLSANKTRNFIGCWIGRLEFQAFWNCLFG
eukprot:3539836-Amphidinium_carterae.1